MVGVNVRVGVRVNVLVAPLGVLVIVGVNVAVGGVGVPVVHGEMEKVNCNPGLTEPGVLHANCVKLLAPVPFCTPIVALLPSTPFAYITSNLSWPSYNRSSKLRAAPPLK